jgi:hypothetical protein
MDAAREAGEARPLAMGYGQSLALNARAQRAVDLDLISFRNIGCNLLLYINIDDAGIFNERVQPRTVPPESVTATPWRSRDCARPSHADSQPELRGSAQADAANFERR